MSERSPETFLNLLSKTLWEDEPALDFLKVGFEVDTLLISGAEELCTENRSNLELLADAVYPRGLQIWSGRDSSCDIELDKRFQHRVKSARARLADLQALAAFLNRKENTNIDLYSSYEEILEATREFLKNKRFPPEAFEKRSSCCPPAPTALQSIKAYLKTYPSELAYEVCSNHSATASQDADLNAYGTTCVHRKKEAKVGDYKKGCLMLALPAPLALNITRWSHKNFREDQLAPDGIEWQPHITILFGFPADFDPKKLKPVLSKFSEIRIDLREIRRFKNEEDCLHLRVVSEDLRRLNAALRKEFPEVEVTYPDYKPHCTLAYVRPGTHLRLDGSRKFNDTTAACDKMIYTGPGIYAAYYTDSGRMIVETEGNS